MFLGKVQLPCEVRCATKEVATEVPTKAGIVWWRAMLKGLLLVAFLAAMPLSMLVIDGITSEGDKYKYDVPESLPLCGS